MVLGEWNQEQALEARGQGVVMATEGIHIITFEHKDQHTTKTGAVFGEEEEREKTGLLLS